MRRVHLFLLFPVLALLLSSALSATPPRPAVATTTTITMTASQSYSSTPAVETVTVSDSINSYPDGTVSCSINGASPVFTGTLTNGSVTWPISGLAVGSYSLSCTYVGNVAFLTSTSQTVQQQIIAAPQPVWNQSGSMSTPRSGQAAVVLGNGTVLLAGGVNASQSAQNTAQIFDPSNSTITPVGNTMQYPRAGATASLLNNGQVLIAGGGLTRFLLGVPISIPQATTDVYNPSTNQFVAGPSMSYVRCGAASITLQTGDILIVGGASNAPAEIYGQSSGTFSVTGSPINQRDTGFTATLLQNGKVLITGGVTNLGCSYNVNQVNTQNILSSAEIYDPSTGTFTATTGSMNVPRLGHTATLLSSGKVLIVGGTSDLQNGLASAELYDPATGTFTYATGSLNLARSLHATIPLTNGLVLITGGANPLGGTGGTRTVLSSAELYNPATQTFTQTASLNTARTVPMAITLSSGAVLVFGGAGQNSILSSIEIYTPTTVSGWVNPKYVIVGVTYAPPGQNSTVSYGNSISQGNTTTISNSFSNDIGLSVSIGNGITVGSFFANGQIRYTASSSTDYSQGTSSSQAVTLSKQVSFAQTTHGIPDSFAPVNHDYDIVWLWLNPLALFTVDPSQPSTLVWNGYGFDPNDIPTQDIYPVFVGMLNGDIPMDQSTTNVLARSWAQNQNWPAGEGPALTPSDYAIIMQADPFVNCYYNNTNSTYTSCYFAQNNTSGTNFGPPLPTNSTDGRFTLAPTNQSIPYVQSGPTTTYTQSTTNTTVNTQQSNHSFKEAFGLDVNFTLNTSALAFFAAQLTIDTKYSQTLNWTHSYQMALTNSTTNTSSATIAPVACVNGNCSTYAGPGEFLIYQDNLYGTYMFYPVH